MLKIVNGSFEDLKREMNQANTSKKVAIKNLKKMTKEIGKQDPQKVQLTVKYQKDIENLEFYTKKMFAPNKVLPVKVEGIVINFKAYQTFVKKIERLENSIFLSNGCLRIDYKTGRYSKGYVEFADLSEYFQDFAHIPVARISEDGSEG